MDAARQAKTLGIEELAKDLGLSAGDFLFRSEKPGTLEALGRILTEKLHEKFVSPEQVRELHPGISKTMAESAAFDLSMGLLSKTILGGLGGSSPITRSGLEQVVAGTSMATKAALDAVCRGLSLRPEAVLREAQGR